MLERGIRTDFALVRAARGDRHGNLVFSKSSRQLQPARGHGGQGGDRRGGGAGEPGDIDPDAVHLPGVFVRRVVALTPSRPPTSGSRSGR
ncbi:CoA-transferase [Streptomyces sp. PG2]